MRDMLNGKKCARLQKIKLREDGLEREGWGIPLGAVSVELD